MLWFYQIMYTFDSYLPVLSRILRNLGYEKFVFWCTILSNYLIGANLEYWIGVRYFNSFDGVWIGIIASIVVEFIIMSLKIKSCDWNKKIIELQSTLADKEASNEGEEDEENSKLNLKSDKISMKDFEEMSIIPVK